MSEPITSSASIEEIASDWLQRQHFWTWDAAAQTELEAWLGQALSHRLAYWRLEAAWVRTERLQALRPVSEDQLLPPGRVRKWYFSFGVAAAAAVIAAFVVSAPFASHPAASATYATTIGGHKFIALTDGSQIELNTNSVLRVAKDNPRRVWLDRGEAYFQIRHNALNPFVVIAAGHRVTDLGTKFLLRTAAAQVNLALIEGSARIDSIDPHMQPHSAVLSPGQVAVATPTSLSTTVEPLIELDSELGWRRGIIVFHHTTLDDAVAEFNRYGNQKLIVANPNVGALMLNGTFPTHDTGAFIRVAQQVFHLRVRKDGDRLVLSH